MTILSISLDGCLRLRQLTKNKAVVELRSHLYPGDWTYCVRKNLPIEEAQTFFNDQASHHVNPTRFFQPVVSPGE